MKIAITGSAGEVGKDVVKFIAHEGHHTVQINLNDEIDNETPNTVMKTVDVARDYDGFLKALEGCDALVHLAASRDPLGKRDCDVNANNVASSFNGFRACGDLGIKKICWASSVNAIGLAFANQPLDFPYFPIDEDYPCNPTDSYALSKQQGELQARAFVNWYPGTKIACLRLHEVNTRDFVRRKHANDWDNAAIKTLWGWVNPVATARAILLCLTKTDNWEGCEIFNIHAPTTTQDTPSAALAKQYFPKAEIREDMMSNNRGFWTTEKAERILGWTHLETE